MKKILPMLSTFLSCDEDGDLFILKSSLTLEGLSEPLTGVKTSMILRGFSERPSDTGVI